jgi:TRAP transporter TAXI family solute receptor
MASLAAFAFAQLLPVQATAADAIAIMTGSASGLYYAAGDAICKALAADKSINPIPCKPLASRGSMSNILELNATNAQFAIVQSDIQYNAVTGRGLFATIGADADLRSVFSIHGEAFTVLVRADDPARAFGDLRGRKFSAGRIGTGTRETAEALLEVLGWPAEDRKALVDMPTEDQAEALCSGSVDAIGYLMGHPSPIVAAAVEKCAVRILPVPYDIASKLAEKIVYYRPISVPGGLYSGNAQPVPTVGLRAAVVTTAEVPDRIVRDLVSAVFGNLTILRDASPAFAALTPGEMSTQSLIAPLHPAALDYYRAQGLPTPTVELLPAANTPFNEKDGALRGTKGLSIDPKISAPQGSTQQTVQKPANNSVPVGPGQKWKLESGDMGAKDPSLRGDGSLPDAGGNLRLRLPTQ